MATEKGLMDQSKGMANTVLNETREALAACITTNPGVSEEQLFERFWGHPQCQLLGTLHAMAADGELRCGLLPPPPTGLFSREVKAEEETATRRCYFMDALTVVD